MRVLMSGNEAIARGVWEAGVHHATGYPGTPSTEILESLLKYEDLEDGRVYFVAVAAHDADGNESPLSPELASLPRPDIHQSRERLPTIRGMVPSILNMPTGCKFCTRCEQVMDRCHTEEPPLHEVADGQQVRCHLVEDAAMPARLEAPLPANPGAP